MEKIREFLLEAALQENPTGSTAAATLVFQASTVIRRTTDSSTRFLIPLRKQR